MSNSTVSIVITAYNAERFIESSVAAALGQTYPNIEVIVVDDGSADATGPICRGISDARVRYINQGRLGRPRALNVGIGLARGQYIAINDADDLSFPDRIQYAMEFFSTHPGLAYIGTAFAATDVFFESLPRGYVEEAERDAKREPIWPTRRTIFRRNLFNNSTLVYPKSTWEKVGGYDETLTLCEDYDFYLRALQCGDAVLLPRQTVLWYTNPGGFFKRKGMQEYFSVMGKIKKRAHRVLELPFWFKWYHPVWATALQMKLWRRGALRT